VKGDPADCEHPPGPEDDPSVTAVVGVPEERRARVRGVDAELVRTTRLGLESEERPLSGARDDLIERPGVSSVSPADDALAWVLRATYGPFPSTLRRLGSSACDGHVSAQIRTLLAGLGHPVRGFSRPREHDDPADVAVEARRGVEVRRRAPKSHCERREERVSGPVIVGNRGAPRRLLDGDDPVFVGEDSNRGRRNASPRADGQDLADLQDRAGVVDTDASHEHAPFADRVIVHAGAPHDVTDGLAIPRPNHPADVGHGRSILVDPFENVAMLAPA
jgi:hypothetical protein